MQNGGAGEGLYSLFRFFFPSLNRGKFSFATINGQKAPWTASGAVTFFATRCNVV